MILNTSMALGDNKQLEPETIHLASFLFWLVNSGSRLIWGFFMDLLGFKTLNVIISLIEVGVCATLYHFSDNPLIYIIENTLIGLCLGGTLTTITPMFSLTFGPDLGTEIYGMTSFFIGLACMAGPALAKFMNKDGKNYFLLYSIAGGVCLFKFIALLCFSPNASYNSCDTPKQKSGTNKIINDNEDENENENNNENNNEINNENDDENRLIEEN